MGRGFPGSSRARGSMHRSSLPEDRLLYQDLKGLADGNSSTGPTIAIYAPSVATSRCARWR
jgi:hypothetical protein